MLTYLTSLARHPRLFKYLESVDDFSDVELFYWALHQISLYRVMLRGYRIVEDMIDGLNNTWMNEVLPHG